MTSYSEVTPAVGERHALALRDHLETQKSAMTDLLARLAEAESPTDAPVSHAAVRSILIDEWQRVGARARCWRGRGVGDGLLVCPSERRSGRPWQLLVGHFDTVWPLGTLQRMPVRLEHGRLHGPGVFDMKAGLVMMIHAVAALRELGLDLPADPVAFINADEEIGSPGSQHRLARIARGAARAWVLEPSMGPTGKLKTARKGIAQYTLRVTGRASHAGLAPEEGASAIHELARIIAAVRQLNDPARGVTVNVGVISGGTRPNVVAAHASAELDVRVLTAEDGERIDAELRAVEPSESRLRIVLEGGFLHPPLERSSRNRRLWHRARSIGRSLGLDLDHVTAGGASDGNVTSRFTATLDGLGAVGDGAHADHEHIVVDELPTRTALLAALLLSPLEP